jgi:hypothetical protein
MSTPAYRQGDILIIATNTIPDNLSHVPLENGRIVLARGEATGHAHVLDGEALFMAADLEEMADRFLRVEHEAQVVHEEHDPITLPPGYYIVRRQREYAPDALSPIAD